ncbi:MAG TPA: RsmD family RNA methyltransferase [Alphaproteobacteria bacterium]|jgi:16S rRNA (guanine966-N2)-methyltransferase
MRIVAGKHRGRELQAPAGDGTRPTLGRARQSLFDILEHGKFSDTGESLLPNARVLEAFAGSGAFGFEALSRSAAFATLMDNAKAAQAAQRANAAMLGETPQCRILAADATRPPPADAPCGLVFLDPPYGKSLAAPALAALAQGAWIDGETLVIVEVASKEAFAAPEGFALLDERVYGPAKFMFLRLGS